MKDMKSVNTVRTSSVMVSRWVRQWSRIISILPVLCLLMMQMIGVGNVWGKKKTFYAKCIVIATPAGGGDVYVAQSKQKEGGFTFKDERDESSPSGEAGGLTWTATSKEFTLYGYQQTSAGYTFKGWSTSSTATSGDTSTDTDWLGNGTYPYHTFSVTSTSTNSSFPTTVTYYAIFTPNTYTVKFNANTGSGSMNNMTFTYDESKNLTANAFSKTGYTFSGWNTQANGQGTSYTDGQSVSNLTTVNGGTVTLYAQWTANTYYVAFDGNGNTSGSMSNQTFKYDAAQNLTSNAYIKTDVITFDANGGSCGTTSISKDASFDGWATSANGDKVYDNQQSVSNLTSTHNQTKTLYAKWSQAQTITLPFATKTNCVLAGWSDGENNVGEAGKTYTVPLGGKTLTAIWITKYPFTVEGSNYELFVEETKSNAFTFTHAHNPVVNISPSGIISYENNTITALSEGVATIYFSQSDDSETILAGESDHWTVTVKRVSNTLALNVAAAQNKYVDEEITGVITGKNSNATVETSSTDATTAYYDVADNKIVIDNNGNNVFTSKTVTIKIWQAQNVKYTASGEKTITLTVNKYQTSFSGSAYNLKVDGTQTANYSYSNTSADQPTASSNDDFYYTIDEVSFANEALNNGTNLVTFNPANKQITACNAGTAQISLHQKETYKYTGATTSFNVAVTKHSNTIYVKGNANYSSSIYVDLYDNGLTLTSDNTDYTNCPITNTQTAGTDIATFYQNDKVVYSSYKLGTATWTLSQPENYKYVAGSGSFTVNVIQQPAEDCYVLNEPSQQTSSHTYNLNGRGKILYIDFRRSWGDVSSKIKIIGISSKGEEEIDSPSWDDNWTRNKSYDISSKDYTQIKVELSGGVNTKYYENLKVTRQTWLNIATDSGNNGTLTINKKSDGYPINPGQTGVANSKIYWSCVDGGDLKIVCENPHFSFSQNTITNTACNNGTTDITVSYTNTEPGTETATVTVYNKMYRQTFTVKGVIEKADQLITWNNDILRLGQSYNNVATANTLVTYESENESIIRVDEDDKGHKTILTAVGTGTVNITATAEETSFYAEKSDTKSIKVTDKQIQWIDWNQSLFGLKLGGANVTMNAVAASDVEGCGSSRLIEYSSSNESVVKVVNNNQLQIIDVGTAIITAVQAGGFDTDGHDYERAETEKTVIVRDPNAPCESFAYQQGQEVKMDCGWNALNKQTRTSEINFNGIIPATGTLRYKGEYRKVAINYFDGTMTVEQYIPGENWQPVTGGDLGKPSIGTYKTANLTFDRRATKMRVKVTDGLGYHYFTDCQVTQARFIETTAPVDFNLNVGQQQNQVIYLSYSNITDGLSLTLAQGANSHFSVDKSFIEGSCGSAAKNVALTITYHPTAEETNAQDVLTITDGTTSCQVVLTGSATRVNRHIIWDHADETNIYTVQTETLSAEARTDLNELAGVVTFSLASSSTATGAISMENVLSFTSAGVANVVAYTTDDARYNAAPNVTKVFNVSKTPTTISTLPVLEAVTSGTAVGDVELTGWQVTNTVNGGVVEGTLAITSADLINVGTNTVTLTFTPSNTDMYVGCTSTMTIVVNKATSVATPSAANIVYGQKVSASLLSNVGTDGTWAWNTENNEAVLDAGTHEGLAVHFTPTSGNYTELDATVSLTVEKANPEVTAQASAITYGQAISASELSTATGSISGTWAWAVDEEQVLSVGDHVLKANFTSTNANYNNLSNVDVTLTVNKIEELEVPVALSFCAGESVNFHGNTYTEAGEYQVEAEGEIRDTVYNVTVTKLQPTTGTDSKTIAVGANESWNGIDLSGYAVGSHEVVFHTENVAGCDSTVTLSLTVVPLSNVFTNAAGNGDWEDRNNWQSGIVPTSDPDIIVTGALEVNEDITVGSLTIESTGSVAVISGGTLTVNGTSEDRTEYGDVHVMSDGALALGNSADLKVRDFTLDAALGNSSNAATSGQVSGDVNLHINRDAYFQMSFDPRGYITLGWYDMTVPFEVEVLNGVYDNYMNKLTNGVDYLVMSYDEVKRASSGNGWALFNGTMQPGRIYTITLEETKTWNTFIFKKKSGSNLLSNGSCTAQYSSIGEAKDRGWNGLGNGTLQHRELAGLSGRKVQVYNFQEKIYEAFDADEKAYAVGTAFFVQADANMGTIDLTTTDGTKALRAPQYASRELDEFRLTLTAEGEDRYTDRMWVSASEEATGEYVIGHDLLKMGTPKDAKVAQMWTVNNDLRLCDIEMPLMDDKAQCPLMFFAPNAQTFEIAVDKAPEDATLYLTYNDRIIWSLSASPYTIDLAKGMTEGYGLRIVARHNAPSVATGIDEVNVDQDGNRKVLIDNMLYIITPEGAMYSVTGEKVK